jgi:putative PIN family toxin of toxin-antitoxin system
MRILLDTNVWLSAIFWEGEASKIVELAEKRKFEIIISKDIILEIIDVLNKEAKFKRFMQGREQNIEDLIRTISSIGSLIDAKTKVDIIKEHPADNIILEASLDGKADFIVSYDKHILNLREFRGIRIIEPTEFLKCFGKKES